MMMMKNVRRSIRRGRRSAVLSALVGVTVLGAVVVSAEPASANVDHIHGSQETYVNVMYNSPHVDTYSLNSDGVKMTSVSTGAGGTYAMGMRRLGVTASYAKATQIPEIGSSFTPFRNVSTGANRNPPGTFYLTVSIVGGCGGDGCGTINWEADLSYNVNATQCDRQRAGSQHCE